MRKLKKLPPLKKRERPFEYRLRDELKKRGVMFVKVKPSVRGLPDRLAMGLGNMLLAELKREAGDLPDHQLAMHAEIKRLTRKRVLVVFGPDVEKQADFVYYALATWR